VIINIQSHAELLDVGEAPINAQLVTDFAGLFISCEILLG